MGLAAQLGRRGRIISVTLVGDAASAHLNWDLEPDKSGGFLDFHSLLRLRIDGVWKITDKTATRSSR
jgi:hypothetical protein